MSIRILSYNIHGGTGIDRIHDYVRINQFFEKQDIDIALLQEVNTRPAERSTEQDIANLCGDRFKTFIPGISVQSDDGWYGNAILSRFPCRTHEIIDISYPGREPRNIMEAVLETDQGPLRVLNTHKGLKHRERISQLKMLHKMLDRYPDLPLFLGGDLNIWHTSVRSLQDINETLYSVKTGGTFPTWFFWPILQLDRVWCRPDHLIKHAETLHTPETKIYSDHYPILIELDDLNR